MYYDDDSLPKHFTPFLTLLVSEYVDLVENRDLIKLAVHDKFNNKDLVMLTEINITVPMKTQDLKHHLKNIAILAGLWFGENYVLFKNLQDIANHVEEK